jgi:hypothetical protein
MTVGNDPMSIAVQGAALVSLVWSCAVFLVQTIGITQLYGLPYSFCTDVLLLLLTLLTYPLQPP